MSNRMDTDDLRMLDTMDPVSAEPADDEPHRDAAAVSDPVITPAADPDNALGHVTLQPAAPTAGKSDLRTGSAALRGATTGADIGEPAFQIQDAGTLQEGDRVQQYEIIREIGRGGMGVVYLARDTRLARLVAIKFLLRTHLAHGERFLVEARATARCHHVNIVVIHDVAAPGSYPFMVLEYLRGHQLRDLMDDKPDDKPMAPQQAVELIIPVLLALELAHTHGIVHRDLKPENIFVTASGEIKVLDFGIAKMLAEPNQPTPLDKEAVPQQTDIGSLTMAGKHIGTLPYMSPEQLRGDPVDQQTDLWAVGIMLYEMVAGAHPLHPLSRGKFQRIAHGKESMPSARTALPKPGTLAVELGAELAVKLADIIDRCLEIDQGERVGSARELITLLQALGTDHKGPVLGDDHSPFSGLAAFQEADAERFFGRSREIASILALLRWHPLVTVVGPSGSGKSSLVRAGVIPALKRLGEGWRSMVLRPGRRPLEALSEAFIEANMGTMSTNSVTEMEALCADDLTARWHALPGSFGSALRGWARRKNLRVVLLVDQLEELYTLDTAADERVAFIKCLQGVADDAASPLRVITTVRSDFLDQVINASDFNVELTRGLTFLPPMNRDCLREALTAPVQAVGYSFESESLIEAIIDGLEHTPGALPLMQFAATQLWQSRDREVQLLTQASYDAMGGVAGTLASHADAVLAAMSANHVDLAKDIFQRLVTPERTRAIVSIGELGQLPGDTSAIEHVVAHLADARLLAIEEGTGQHESAVEIIHESLIQSWPTLRRWLDDNEEDAEFLARVRAASQQWQQSGHSDDLLWRGDMAEDAKRWRRRYRGALSTGEAAYLAAVTDLNERAARRRRAMAYGTIAVLTALLLAATVAIVWILRAEDQVAEHAQTIEQQKEELRLKLNEATRAEEIAQREKSARRGRASPCRGRGRQCPRIGGASPAGQGTSAKRKSQSGRSRSRSANGGTAGPRGRTTCAQGCRCGKTGQC